MVFNFTTTTTIKIKSYNADKQSRSAGSLSHKKALTFTVSPAEVTIFLTVISLQVMVPKKNNIRIFKLLPSLFHDRYPEVLDAILQHVEIFFFLDEVETKKLKKNSSPTHTYILHPSCNM